MDINELACKILDELLGEQRQMITITEELASQIGIALFKGQMAFSRVGMTMEAIRGDHGGSELVKELATMLLNNIKADNCDCSKCIAITERLMAILEDRKPGEQN